MSEIGYVYRIPNANGVRLKQFIKDIVGQEGWTFGGAALWDFDAYEGPNNLRAVTSIGTGENNITGDFGHAFSKQAEVRWKRRSDDSYDVLILSDSEQTIKDATQLGEAWEVQTNNELKIKQTRPDSGKLRYKTYHAPNGAVQFVRYTEVHP